MTTNLPGRPREHNREQISIDMIQWAKKEDSINLNKFCALYDPPIPPSKITHWAKEEDYFRQAYESTKAFIAFRREEKLNAEELHVKAYDLNAATYDHFLKDERRQQAEFEASLKSQLDIKVDEGILDNYKQVIGQLKRVQSECKIEDNNINNEQKSA
jgi:hypothetical protein